MKLGTSVVRFLGIQNMMSKSNRKKNTFVLIIIKQLMSLSMKNEILFENTSRMRREKLSLYLDELIIDLNSPNIENLGKIIRKPKILTKKCSV